MNCDPALFTALKFNPTSGSYRIDHAKLRGTNYFSIVQNPLVFWRDYDSVQVDKDLDSARKIGLNSLRVFLSYEAYTIDPALYRNRVTQFLSAICSRGIVALLVVTDFAFGWFGKNATERWSGSPGVFFMSDPAGITPFGSYLDELLSDFSAFPPWLVMFDIANEPSSNPWLMKDMPLPPGTATIPAITLPEKFQVAQFMIAVLDRIFAQAPGHEVTIGQDLGRINQPSTGQPYPFTFESRHGGYTDVAELTELFQKPPLVPGMPVVLTETAADPSLLPTAVQLSIQHQRGFMFWGMMKGYNQWNSFTGLFYKNQVLADATALAAVNAIHGSPVSGVTVATKIPLFFEVLHEKAALKRALRRLRSIEVVDADNANEIRSLPWELLYWGYFDAALVVNNELVALHAQIESAIAKGNTAHAYALIHDFAKVAQHAAASFELSPPHSVFLDKHE